MEEEIIIYPENIEISANRADEDQFWRIQRIHRVLGYAQALADTENNEDFYKKIESIYDYKGSITTIWVTEPTVKEKDYLQKAWESIVTNYEGNPIEHELK